MKLRDTRPRDEPFTTYSGRRLDLRAPDVHAIDIDDIAHGLAYQCLAQGQVRYFYSLAQHSLLVATLVPPQQRLAALLHDAAAAYLGDAGGPLAGQLPDRAVLESGLLAAIGEKFGIADFATPAIRRAHQVAVVTEQRDLQRPGATVENDGKVALMQPVPIPRRIDFMSPEEARYQFIELFRSLYGKRRVARPAARAATTPSALPVSLCGKPRTLTLVGKTV